jgi:hypothetical protein
LKEELQKYMAENEKTEIIQLMYIGNIQVIDAFFASQQCNSRVFDTGSVGMSVLHKQHDRRNTMA